MINLKLVRKQELSDDAAYRIMMLQEARGDIHKAMKLIGDTGEKELLKHFKELLPAIEATLQKLWKFDIDPSFYKFWNVPHCSCCKMDNNDNFPIGPYYVKLECPVHGENDEHNKSN